MTGTRPKEKPEELVPPPEKSGADAEKAARALTGPVAEG